MPFWARLVRARVSGDRLDRDWMKVINFTTEAQRARIVANPKSEYRNPSDRFHHRGTQGIEEELKRVTMKEETSNTGADRSCTTIIQFLVSAGTIASQTTDNTDGTDGNGPCLSVESVLLSLEFFAAREDSWGSAESSVLLTCGPLRSCAFLSVQSVRSVVSCGCGSAALGDPWFDLQDARAPALSRRAKLLVKPRITLMARMGMAPVYPWNPCDPWFNFQDAGLW